MRTLAIFNFTVGAIDKIWKTRNASKNRSA